MREYELTVIIQPEISEEGSAAILERLDESMASQGALRLLCDDLGKRKLAYEISRFHKGHYYLVSFLDEGAAIPELERLLRLDESVLRFLTVKVNDLVADVEGRRAEAKDKEIELQRRAAEKAAREAEDAAARAEAERVAAEEAAAKAAAEAEAAAERAAATADGDGDEEAATDSGEEAPASAEGTAPAAEGEASGDSSDEAATATADAAETKKGDES